MSKRARAADGLTAEDRAKISEVASIMGKIGGRIGGRSRSRAKVAACRANGKKGGRPRKNKVETKGVNG